LIHQPTPYRLPGLDDQSDTDSDEDNEPRKDAEQANEPSDENKSSVNETQTTEAHDAKQELLQNDDTINNVQMQASQPVDLTNSQVVSEPTTVEADKDVDEAENPPLEENTHINT